MTSHQELKLHWLILEALKRWLLPLHLACLHLCCCQQHAAAAAAAVHLRPVLELHRMLHPTRAKPEQVVDPLYAAAARQKA
jgi:hypothetical protein